LHLLVIAVVASKSYPLVLNVLQIFNGSPGDINRGARLDQFKGYTFANSATRSGNKSNFSF